jgi:hypothetical protein
MWSQAWVSESKNVLSACLGFLTLLFYVRHAQRREKGVRSSEEGNAGGAVTFLSCRYRRALFHVWAELGETLNQARDQAAAAWRQSLAVKPDPQAEKKLREMMAAP